MTRAEITAHIIVRNEDRYIWYAIQSVLPFVQKCLIYDTGSDDNTVPIINSIDSEKIRFKEYAAHDITEIGKLRQLQIEETETDWFWIVDGDEMYPTSVCHEIRQIVKGNGEQLEGIAVQRYDLIGDIYHYQSETVGTYDLFRRRGHHVIRLLNKKNLPGLHVEGIYPNEGYYDQNGAEVIHHDPEKYKFTEGRILHAMYLQRSSRGANLRNVFHRKKWKIEKGIPIPSSYKMPEVISAPRPAMVPDISKRRSYIYEAMSSLITPVKQLKRKFL